MMCFHFNDGLNYLSGCVLICALIMGQAQFFLFKCCDITQPGSLTFQSQLV